MLVEEWDDSEYDEWDQQITKAAKARAKAWFKAYVERQGNIHINYDTQDCKIDEVYYLTKIQQILLRLGICLDYEIGDDPDDNDCLHRVDVYLTDIEDVDDDDDDDETESESDDPVN